MSSRGSFREIGLQAGRLQPSQFEEMLALASLRSLCCIDIDWSLILLGVVPGACGFVEAGIDGDLISL